MSARRRGHRPRRTCVGCRTVREQDELVRLVRRADGTVVADATRMSGGRGAWVCAAEVCVTTAIKMRLFGQAFRKPCEVGSGLAEEVRGLWRQR
ncbi:MAG: YlxR family protein [Candidatus Rokubacteria bacterium]|nr:YlxR family protein [Candidatus Rokubacteria bacterium]